MHFNLNAYIRNTLAKATMQISSIIIPHAYQISGGLVHQWADSQDQDSFPTRSRQFTGFLLGTTALELEVPILTPAA